MDASHTVSHMVLETLRKINRAIALRSRYLAKTVGLTVPQLLILREVVENGEAAIGHVAEVASLSQATVTTIVDRLEIQGMIVRRRGSLDRRKVLVAATEKGAAIAAGNPEILQREFTEAFSQLENWEQTQILSSLQRIVSMMNAQQVSASPMMNEEVWIASTADYAAPPADNPFPDDKTTDQSTG